MKKSSYSRQFLAGLSVAAMAAAVTVACSSLPDSADNAGRIRIIRTQAQLDAVSGFTGTWTDATETGLLRKNIFDWKAADTGKPLDGLIIAGGAKVKLALPGELNQAEPGTFYLPAGKFIKVEPGASLQLCSGVKDGDYDNVSLIVGGTGTANPAVSEAGNNPAAASIHNPAYAHALEIAAGGEFILGSDRADAQDTAGPTTATKGMGDNCVLWLADGRSVGKDGQPSPYAGDIRVDGDLKISCAAGAGVAKIRTVRNLQGNSTTLKGQGKMLIYGLNKTHGNAIFAINEFDRGELSDGMDSVDAPEIDLGAIEIIGHGVEGIYNPDGSVDGSPGYRNNANAGFYYVAGSGTINAGSMVVRSTNPGVTADATVALANFNTKAGILGGKVTDTGPTIKLGRVEVENAAADDHDGPLSSIYTVQGVIDTTVTGDVKVTSPGGGAAAIVSTGHGRWTGPEKTVSKMGSVTVTAAGKNAFFQSNTFKGYGTTVNGDVTISGHDDGSIARFVGQVPPGPDMGKAQKPGVAPDAEDVRHEQLLVQGGALKVGGVVTVKNTAGKTVIRNLGGAKTELAGLKVDGRAVGATTNLTKLPGAKLENRGKLQVLK